MRLQKVVSIFLLICAVDGFIRADDALARSIVTGFSFLFVLLAMLLLCLRLMYLNFNNDLVLSMFPYIAIGKDVTVNMLVRLVVFGVVIYLFTMPVKHLLYNIFMEIL